MIAFSSNNDKRIKSIDSIETYALSEKDLLSESLKRREEIKCNNIIKRYKND